MMFVPTCSGCGGQRMYFLEPTEAEMTMKRVGNRVTMTLPPPPLCLDCGGTSSSFKPRKQSG